MWVIRLICTVICGSALLAAPGASSSAPAPAPSTSETSSAAELRASVLAADERLFELYFNRCEPETMTNSVMAEVEFYHDKAGVIARNAQELVADYTKSCNEKLKEDAWRSRRVLLADSAAVYPVPGFGAIEEGIHEFYERQGEGAERRVGKARFLILWQHTAAGWKPARIFSHAHEAITEHTP